MPSALALHDGSAGLLSGPPAPTTETGIRWKEAARRRRLLEGLWKVDLKEALAREFDPRRRRAQGPPDLSKNLFRSLITQLAVLYDRPPVIEHVDATAVEAMEAICTNGGLWQIAVTMQQMTLGIREGFYRFDVPPGEDPKLLVRIIPADLLWLDAPPDCPDQPNVMHEYRLREDSEGRKRWTRDVIDVSDPGAPFYRVESADGKVDLSDAFIGNLSGDAYPYRKTDGTPILPGSLYHATRTGNLWDPFRGIELVDGTLVVAGLWTQWRHLVRDASWPQRWAINAVVDGLDVNKDGSATVVTDPASLLNFRPKIPGSSAAVGQFAPGGDPQALGDAIRDYAADLAADFDLSPGDIKRTHTDPRSGFAIEIERSGQRSAQRRSEPQFSRGDEASLSVIATLWNRATGSTLPEDGWGIRYLGLPLSAEERRLVMEDHKMRAEMGITSKPALLAAVEGITLDQARRQLVQFQLDNDRFEERAAPAPAPNAARNAPEDDDEDDQQPTPENTNV